MDMAKHRQAEWEEWLVCRAALAQRVSQHVRCLVWHASDRPAPAGPGLAAFEASLPSFVATQPNRLGVLYCSYVQQVPAAALEALARLTGICALSFGQCEEEPVNAMLSALAGGLCHMDCIPWRASAGRHPCGLCHMDCIPWRASAGRHPCADSGDKPLHQHSANRTPAAADAPQPPALARHCLLQL